MSEDPPRVELWVLALELALVIVGAWLWEGGAVRLGEWLASWALTAVLLGFVAGAAVPWTRGVPGGARWLSLTLGLSAIGALLTATVLTGILVLSVIRTGLSPSGEDVLQALRVGGPSGLWLGAVAGGLSGGFLGIVVLIVEGLLGTPPSEDRPDARRLALIVAGACLVLAGAAEAQHWAPAYLVTGCASGCTTWIVGPVGRVLGATIGVNGVVAATWLLARHEGMPWRAPLAVAALAVGVTAFGLGNTVFSSTHGPQFRRATLGMPPMPVPLSRDLVNATVADRPGWLYHTIEVRWPDDQVEHVLVGLGPFRPDTRGLVGAFSDTAEAWQGDAMPGRN